MNISKEDAFALNKEGILTKKLVLDWIISPELGSKARARSDVFTSGSASSCLVLTTDSDEPESVTEFTVWLYRKAAVTGSVSVSFALLDNQDKLRFAVKKCVSDIPSEFSRISTTFDLSICPKHSEEFFHHGMLRIRCSVDSFEELSECPNNLGREKIPGEDSKLKVLLREHLSNFPKWGRLSKRDYLKWSIPEQFIHEGEARSDAFTFGSSKLWLVIIANPYKSKERSNLFRLFLFRETKAFERNAVKVNLAILDTRERLHHTVEEVLRDSSNSVSADFEKNTFQNRWRFFSDGKLLIHCSLRTDISLGTQDAADLRTAEPSELSHAVEKLVADFASLFESKKFSDVTLCADGKEIEAHRIILALRSSTFADNLQHVKMGQKVNIELAAEVLHELLRYIYTANVACSNTLKLTLSLLEAAEEYSLPELKEMCSKRLHNHLKNDIALKVLVAANRLKDNGLKEAAIQMVLKHASCIFKTDEWLMLLKEDSELANDIIKRLVP